MSAENMTHADGTSTAANAAAIGDDTRGLGSTPLRGVVEEVSGVLSSVRETVSSFLELVSLEARRAGAALVWMVAGGMVAGACLVATWLGLMAALAMWVTSLGLSPILAVLVVTLLNLALAGGIAFAGIRMSESLAFPATRRQIAGHRAAKATAP
jgi:hypothetical protein